MNATHTQWPVFIGVWVRCSGRVHPGEVAQSGLARVEVAQSGLARFEVARVEVARVEVALVEVAMVEVASICSNTGTGPYWNRDEDWQWAKTGGKTLHKCSLIATSLQYKESSIIFCLV